MKKLLPAILITALLVGLGLIVFPVFLSCNAAMFGATDRDVARARKLLSAPLGELARSAKVPRVNRDINAVYVLLPNSDELRKKLNRIGTPRKDLPANTIQFRVSDDNGVLVKVLCRMREPNAPVFCALVREDNKSHVEIVESSFERESNR